MSIRTLLSLLTLFSFSAQAAQVSRIYNFVDGSILTALQLNSEFNNLVNGVNNLDSTNFISNANFLPSQINATIAGSGISRNGSTGVLGVNVDNLSLDVVSNQVEIKDGGVTSAKLATDFSGVITMYGGSTAPAGWFLCDGSAVSRTTYAALFAVIGTSYGVGDSVTTFNLPDMRSRFPLGAGPGPGLTSRSNGDKGGAESETLTLNELPAHSHTSGSLVTSTAGSHVHLVQPVFGANTGTAGSGVVNTVSSNGSTTGFIGTNVGAAGDHTHTISGSTNTVGGGMAFPLFNPYLVVTYIIKQ